MLLVRKLPLLVSLILLLNIQSTRADYAQDAIDKMDLIMWEATINLQASGDPYGWLKWLDPVYEKYRSGLDLDIVESVDKFGNDDCGIKGFDGYTYVRGDSHYDGRSVIMCAWFTEVFTPQDAAQKMIHEVFHIVFHEAVEKRSPTGHRKQECEAFKFELAVLLASGRSPIHDNNYAGVCYPNGRNLKEIKF